MNQVHRSRRSDRAGEFGERVRDATMHTRVDTEFVVATADVLHERVSTNDRARRPIAFQTAHRTESCLQPTVIILDPIARVLIHVVNAPGRSSSIPLRAAPRGR